MAQELFDRAAICLKKHLPFVLYRKPNTIQLTGVFQNTDEVHKVRDFTESGFVFAPFNLKSDTILMKMDTVLRGSFDLYDENTPIAGKTNQNNTVEEPQYLDLVSNAIKKIKQGDFDKVVLSRMIEVESKDDYFDTYQRLLRTYEKAFCYFWYHPKIGTWMGATPEILIKSRGTSFTTMSLAGTQSSIEFSKPVWTKKELNEQQVVTDYIINALKDKVISIETSEMESVQAGQLWHLRTEIKGVFLHNHFGSVLNALHPTPAVCGTPVEVAKKFIVENEMYDRSFYTGFLGELNMTTQLSRNKNKRNQENSAYGSIIKKSELFVNLRCMQLKKNTISIYVGGGITKDSIPKSEWEETVLKSNTMFRVLNNK